MGIIRAAVNAVHGSLADQWLETVEPYEMGEHTVFTAVSYTHLTLPTTSRV